MDKQLTVGKLIEFLEKIRKNHGDNVPVYHSQFDDELIKSRNVRASYVDEDEDEPIVSIVISGH